MKKKTCSFPGRIRTTPESEDDDNDTSVLSLGLFPGEYLEYPGEDRTLFRFEAAWDSSLHNSVLLNRVTPHGEHVYMTISAYLEVVNVNNLRCVCILCIILIYHYFHFCIPEVIRFISLSYFVMHFSWKTMPNQLSSQRTCAWLYMVGTLEPFLGLCVTYSVDPIRMLRQTGSAEFMRLCWSAQLKQVAQVCGLVLTDVERWSWAAHPAQNPHILDNLPITQCG